MVQKRKTMSQKLLVMFLQMASLILLLSSFPYSAFGAPETSVSAKQQILIDVPIKQYDASFAVTPKVVFYKLKYKKGITLIDIRRPQDFKRLRIPASINIPLHFIKSKTFLKPTPVVLVHEGFGYSRLISECRRLKALGFKISILDGGLPAWHRKGGRLVGDLLALNEMLDISPRQFLPESNYRNLLLIDVSPNRAAESIRTLPHAVHLPDLMHSASLQKSMRQMIEARRSRLFQSILVFNNTGENYAAIKLMMERKGIDAFYLQDGLSAYQKYLKNLALSWKSRDRRTRTFSNCKPCGEKFEAETFQPGK
jgi:rhodanese-related sulfurtransferase